MPQQTVPGTLVQEGNLVELAAVLAAVSVFDGALLHLYQSIFTPTPTSKAADFLAAEATYSGYAPVALTYSAVGVDANGVPTALSNRAFFQCTDGLTPNQIGGCWVQIDTAGPVNTVLRYYAFGAPLNMTAALEFLAVVLAITDPVSPGSAIVDN